ncbi:EscU/YscU/HrcU family type III secretion system export apparatus switch protein [Xylophilus sp. Kf1]|nr:EscU/YscU/HrcU family type III secretion system export apparatus switch protein [Xylophilus sp. Kf1]
MSDEKKLPPTAKKLRDAREDGESITSPDVASAGVVVAAVGALWLSAGFMMDRLTRLFRMVWEHLPRAGESMGPLLYAIGGELLLLTLPFALATLLGAALALLLQGSLTMSAKPVMLNLDAVNPVNGLKKIFGMKSALEAGTMALKGLVLFSLLYSSTRDLLPLLVGATGRSPLLMGVLMWQLLMRLLFIAVGLFVVFAVVDYGIQRFVFMRDHRMSEDEVKRENKEQSGNPEVKQARRELAQELLNEEPQAGVAKARLVVANPTHFAVAIGYERGGVPQVLAKGQDALALAIRAEAERLDIPIIVNPPLARTLFKVPLGAGIPRDCFQVIGLMLHWVDQLKADAETRRSKPAP